VELIEYLPGALAAVAVTIRIVVFFTTENRPAK
jgi:hypothetical protein